MSPRCYCSEECLAKGGADSSGRPLGVLFPNDRQLANHQLRVKRQRDARECAEREAERLAAENDLQQASAQLFASTVLDQSPSLSPGFQVSRDNTLSAAGVTNTSSVEAILEGVRRITLSHDNLPPPPDCHPASSIFHGATEISQNLSISLSNPAVDSLTSALSGVKLLGNSHSVPPTHFPEPPVGGRSPKPSKQERSVRTQTALEILKRVQSDMVTQAAKLVNLPTNDAVDDVNSQIGLWREAMMGIKSRTDSIDTLKSDICQTLAKIEARIAELRNISPNQPIRYSTGK